MENRTSHRIPENLKVAFPCCNKLYAGTVIDMSENGMLIHSEINLPINARFEIIMPIKEKLLKIHAIFVRLVKDGKQYRGMGVKLLYPPKIYVEYVQNLHRDT
jgi:hypothetical protein